ncbi:MAG: SUMF1/EgtB/PvdO family nonheme iron enzyme [Anaerolineae bacterium]
MAGHVWEGTSSIYLLYPHQPDDGREDLEGAHSRAVRGGSFISSERNARCSSRLNGDGVYAYDSYGCRVCLYAAL